MCQLLILQLAFAFVSAQSIDLSQQSFAPSLLDQAASVGLAQPTSPAIYPKTTSPEAWTISQNTASVDDSTASQHGGSEFIPGQSGGSLNVLGGASDGDLHGANPRQNMVYFGIGRHGFGLGAECDGPCGNDVPNCHADHGHQAPPEPIYPTARPETTCEQNQPYLKVTPTKKVQAFTRTHVETRTSTVYDIHTSRRTRTVTDAIRSTSTDYVHPEKTYTYVDYQTVYEYPAATIDASNIQRPNVAGINRKANRNHPIC